MTTAQNSKVEKKTIVHLKKAEGKELKWVLFSVCLTRFSALIIQCTPYTSMSMLHSKLTQMDLNKNSFSQTFSSFVSAETASNIHTI